ncbi:DUF4097 domain-containing protein [Thalassotalea sp. M1531]|uniref:DUF4097 domain-containing protein n=1 Tax=Thalassotalea algicola TaxID=2716224 RepID=A0A7Y0LFE4_9GAMM|nr:DUF4097 family beta strand repeat-containing protein [Thalassotalea algicola]NMP33323.1 DUF4097 domain-containing protein [Thalassotalea algicola]
MEKFNLNIASLIVASSLFATTTQAEETKVIEKSFIVESGASFSIENINGRVEIEKASGNEIEVIATITAKNADDMERIAVLMEQSGSDVTVETKYKDSTWGNNHSSGSVAYKVKLPVSVADSEVDLVNGSLLLDEVSGKLDVDLVNGSIEANNLSGNSELNSVNGSVIVSYSELNSVNKIDVDTVNGSIKVYLPVDANIKVDAETMHGSIKSDFGLSVEKKLFAGKYMKGSVGNASTKLSLESVNGSIKVLTK